MGRQLNKYVASQLEQKAIQSIPTNQRSDDKKSRLRKLQNFINHAKKNLDHCALTIPKTPAKTVAQKKASSRARMSTPEREAQREASRVRMATPEQREATRVRMVVARAGMALAEREAVRATARVRKAEARAGGLSEGREAHEAWVESLVAPPEMPLTEDEKDRKAMLERRKKYFEGLKSKYLE